MLVDDLPELVKRRRDRHAHRDHYDERLASECTSGYSNLDYSNRIANFIIV